MSTTRYSVLVPVSNLQEAQTLLPMAEVLAQRRGGEVLALHVVLVPPGERLSHGATNASRSRQALNNYLRQRAEGTLPVRSMVRVTHNLWEAIWEVVLQEHVDLLLLGWTSTHMPETAGGTLKNQRLLAPPCNVMFVHPRGNLTSEDERPLRILLAVRGGPNDGLALRVAEALAASAQGEITLLHATGEAPRDAEEYIFTHFEPALRGLRHLNRSVTVVGDVTDAISREAQGHDIVVMGASQHTIAPDDWRGKRLQHIRENTQATLVIVKKRAPDTGELAYEERFSTSIERPINVVVDRWFAERTFHSREFADIEHLLRLKEQQELTISLGLPALNEEETVGNVIQTVKRALMDDIPLLDEIVLIDSGSVDYTREIAADMGIPVYIHQEILPAHGTYHGKGEALWKSLYVLKGDLIAWIDTDIKNIHPRFVYG
ncbi:MAG: glycosyltransferase, partial [Anaerolineae bacterium]